MTPPHDKLAAQRVYASRATATLVLAVGALVLLNVAATRLPGRLDLTEDHVYSLSGGSRQIVRSLHDYFTIKEYVSKDLPPELAPLGRYIRDLLEEYRVASGGMLRVERYDPGADAAAAEDAERCRVGTVAVQERRGHKALAGRYYLGLCFWYDGKSRAISEIRGTSDLEYRISALMKRMVNRKQVVAFTAGHGEQDLGAGYSFMKLGISEEAEVVSVNPSKNSISDQVDVLVVAGPHVPFDDKALREIDAFVMRGKGALFLVDGMSAVPAAGAGAGGARRIGQPVDSGLDALLASYGFRIGRDLVFDRANAPGPYDADGRKLFGSAPAFVAVKPDAARVKDHTILAGVSVVVFPFASSVELVGPLAGGAPRDGNAGGGRLFLLARTSPEAWRETGSFALAPDAGPSDPSQTRGSLPLAYAYEGMLRSAYPPVALAGPAAGGAGAAARATSRKPVRLVVAGDSDFAADEYAQLMRTLPIYAGGPQMLLNAVSWTLEDEALTPLRATVLRSRPLEAVPERRADFMKWGNVVGVPAAFCAAGLARWRLRRASRDRQRLPEGKT